MSDLSPSFDLFIYLFLNLLLLLCHLGGVGIEVLNNQLTNPRRK